MSPSSLPRFRSALVGLAVLPLLVVSIASAQPIEVRAVFIGTARPVVLHFKIDAGISDISETRTRYVTGLFDLLDLDGNGKLDADEASEIPRDGWLQGIAIGTNWKSLDIDPTDGEVSPKELSRYLNEQFGPPVVAEKVAPRLAQTVRLFSELDANRNGRADPEEIEQGFELLRAFDFDDDGALAVAELQPFPLSVLQASQEEKTEEDSMLLFVISNERERSAAATAMLNLASAGEPVPRESISAVEDRFFRVFDRNNDNCWDRDEIMMYLERAPVDHELLVTLLPPRVLSRSAGSPTPRPTLDLGGMPVEFRATNNEFHQFDHVSLLLINFIRSDQDKNGYLDTAEFAGLDAPGVQFEAVDRNRDEMVTRDEVKTFFELDALSKQMQLVLSLSDEGVTLFDILDADADNRLTPREFRTARERLLKHDYNQDLAVDPREFRSAFRISVGQPEILELRPEADMDMMVRSRSGRVTPQQFGPLWFQKMDRNADGDIAWQEFLGPRETFEKLDRNQDDFIDLEEAEAAEEEHNDLTTRR